MAQWNFYFSGILYGKIQEEENLYVEMLDIRSGKMSERTAFTEKENQVFQGLCNRNILEFFSLKKEYEERISGQPESFETENGEQFTNRRGESYFQRYRKFPKDLFYEDGKIYAVLMSGRDYTAVLVKDGWEEKTVLSRWEEIYPKGSEICPVQECQTYHVPTRDGEFLATDVYLPGNRGDGKVPAVLVRTPYGKKNGAAVYLRFVQRGYAVVIQDTRGREDSTGEWLPEYYEVEDGDDTLNWIADQEWSDGKVGMTGGSYLGYVQWAAAASGNPHLKAMLSSVCAGSAFVDIPRRGGCFTSGMLAWAFAMSEQRMRPDLMAQDNWDEILDIRPLSSIPQKALGHEVDFLSKWLEHRDMDEFWKRTNWRERYQGAPVPALIMSGWFDDNGMGTTEALELVESWPAGTWKAVLGPWKHSGNADYDLHGIHLGEDALRYDMDILCMMWLEHFLKDVENGIQDTPAVEYFTVGENRWKTAKRWPVETTSPCKYYFGEADGEGSLQTVRSEEAAEDAYVYDPENPSTHIIDMSENELEVPEDYTEEEKREDVLCYSTPVLEEPLTITGDAQVTLFVSCDCPDTDFVVRITDVDEQGKSVKLADGVISAKYRNGFEAPQYMKPGEVYQIKVRTTKISNTFAVGHRMRVTVTSSAKNFIFPNSNTELGFDSEVKQKATVTVHRGGECASFIEVRR